MEFLDKYSGLIALVLLIIALIIFVRTYKEDDDQEQQEQKQQQLATSTSPLDINDEDATVASLIAAIECRNETGKNVHVISVREVK